MDDRMKGIRGNSLRREHLLMNIETSFAGENDNIIKRNGLQCGSEF